MDTSVGSADDSDGNSQLQVGLGLRPFIASLSGGLLLFIIQLLFFFILRGKMPRIL
jgi:hypothetical protein